MSDLNSSIYSASTLKRAATISMDQLALPKKEQPAPAQERDPKVQEFRDKVASGETILYRNAASGVTYAVDQYALRGAFGVTQLNGKGTLREIEITGVNTAMNPGEFTQRSGNSTVVRKTPGQIEITDESGRKMILQRVDQAAASAYAKNVNYSPLTIVDEPRLAGRLPDGRIMVVTQPRDNASISTSEYYENFRVFIGTPGKMEEVKVTRAEQTRSRDLSLETDAGRIVQPGYGVPPSEQWTSFRPTGGEALEVKLDSNEARLFRQLNLPLRGGPVARIVLPK